MDLKLLRQVVAELAEKLTGSRIAKIHQPAADLLIFRLWNGQENLRLLISADPVNSRIHLTTASYPNPKTPPRFCQLLRARISRIRSIEILNDDRIVALRCAGQQSESSLVIELTGRSSNMLLLDTEGVIVDVLQRRVDSDGQRQLLPGQPYRLPDKDQSAGDKGLINIDQSHRASVNMLVDKYYTEIQPVENKTDLPSTLRKLIARQRKKLEKRLKNITAEEGEQLRAERYKQYGELLLANLHAIKRGMGSVEIFNYYLQPAEATTIPLDKRLNPQENAELYFKRFKKAKRGLEHSQRRLLETQYELRWLASLEYQLQEATTAAEIEEVAAECRQNGLQRVDKRYVKKGAGAKSQPLEALSPSGLKILWGRNNRQNDYLSTKLLKSGDFWFHAHNCPGAHVVLKTAGSANVSGEDLEFAASIAAGYSKAKNDQRVEVMQAEAKAVRKPKGARPGMVSVEAHKIIVVQPFRLE